MTSKPLPNTGQLVTPILAGAAVITLTALLSGCTQIMNDLRKVHEESYASYPAAADGWVGVDVPTWIPSDATELRNYATTNEAYSVIRVTSPSEPTGCELGLRTTLPFETPEWVPSDALTDADGALLEHVWLCGDYEVIAHDGEWVGWFAATEEGDTPS